jgi:hypothetical protein
MKTVEEPSKGVMSKRDMPGYVARFLIDKSNGTFYELMQKYSDDGFALPESYKRMMAFKDDMCSIYNEKKKGTKERDACIPKEQDRSSEYGKQRRKKKYKYPKAFKF